ncbi:hypothetical protein IEE94_15765 [Yimella sp. cx-573]|nr:hypothetical protein [Yimella sp. cx-573]
MTITTRSQTTPATIDEAVELYEAASLEHQHLYEQWNADTEYRRTRQDVAPDLCARLNQARRALLTAELNIASFGGHLDFYNCPAGVAVRIVGPNMRQLAEIVPSTRTSTGEGA